MDIFYTLGYYLALYLTPFVVYILIFRTSNYFEGKKDWFYFIKLYFAKSAVENHQKQRRQTGETPNNKPTEKYTNTQYIYGVDQHNNSLSLRFIRRCNQIAEVALCLRLATGDIYTFPGEQNVKIASTESAWKAENLEIETLEDFQRLRITFHGRLRNVKGKIEVVQFNFIWNTASAPRFFPAQAHGLLLAESIASEKWRDAFWTDLLDNLNEGFEQFGALCGFIRRNNEEFQVNLPSVRGNFTEIDVRHSLRREVRIFVAVDDGTLLHLSVKAFKNGCSQLNQGTVISNNGTVLSLTGSDIVLDNLGENGNFPGVFTINIKVPKTVYKCALYLDKTNQVALVNNETKGSECFQVAAECDVNARQARAILEFWYKKKGYGLPPHPQLLTTSNSPPSPHLTVVNLNDPLASLISLTGGKGSSLAVLTNLQRKFENFSVPGGFILTVNAYKKQLTVEIHEAIQGIKDVACGRRNNVTLESACERVVELFKVGGILVEVLEAVEAQLKLKPSSTRWAVRSSGINEDSADLSAAGQNETFLGCSNHDQVLKAIKACWGSQFTHQSVQYRRQHGLPVMVEMAVVVQEMAPVTVAGVLFTCHPSTCDPTQMVITSNYGLGESVVSGKVDPDTIVLTKPFPEQPNPTMDITIGTKSVMTVLTANGVEESTGESPNSSKLSLSEEQIAKLVQLGLSLETQFGGPRDIEWGFNGLELFLLQSRPVTTLNSWTDFELLHEFDSAILSEDNVFTRANIGEVCPGAVTVLSQTSLLNYMEQGIQMEVYEEFNAMVRRSVPVHQHHAFINVISSIHKNVQADIQIASKVLDLAIFGHPVINKEINAIALHYHGAMTRLGTLKVTIDMFNKARKNQATLARMKQLVQIINFEVNSEDSLEGNFKKLSGNLPELIQVATYHSAISSASVFYQVLVMNLLLEGKNEFTTEHYADFAMILSSCEDVVSAEVPSVLGRISALLQNYNLSEEFVKIPSKEGVEWLREHCGEASEMLEEFLEKHGHRLLAEFELKEDSWGMNPRKVVEMLQVTCKNPNIRLEKVEQTVDDIITKLSVKNRIVKAILRRLMKRMRVAVGMREKSKNIFVLAIHKQRLAYRKLAERMVGEGVLPHRDLLYHLSHHEVGLLVNKPHPGLINKAMRRKKLYDTQWCQLEFPEIMFGMPRAESKAEFKRNGSLVICTGTPVCNGTIQARACVIVSMDKIHELEAGDILVTYCTDIGWSPYFPMLSGIVTELGGLVSHGAVVAREYGLPSIVGVKNATKMFKTGDVVLLSGRSGTLELIKEK